MSKVFEFGIAHGRFQPFHNEHLDYLVSARVHCHHLVVGITNPWGEIERAEISSPHRNSREANPFRYFDRYRMVSRCLEQLGWRPADFSIVPFDLYSLKQWPDVLPSASCSTFLVREFSDWERQKMSQFASQGYSVTVIDQGKPKLVTATEVRANIRSNGAWRPMIPLGTASIIDELTKGSNFVV